MNPSNKKLIAALCAFLMVANVLIAPGLAAPALETANVNIHRVGSPNGWSDCPSISADGNLIAFESAADNLVPGDSNGRLDIFVYDVAEGKMERVSVNSDGSELTSAANWSDISADGRWVTFVGAEGGKPYLYVHDRQSATTYGIGYCANSKPTISGDGSKIVFINSSYKLTLAEPGLDGQWGTADDTIRLLTAGQNPDISSNGRYVAYVHRPTGQPYRVFVYDFETNESTVVSVDSLGNPANGSSYAPSISATGRYVSFESDASSLINPDVYSGAYSYNVFRHDRDADNNGVFDQPSGVRTELVNVSSTGEPANELSGNTNNWGSSLSEDGRDVSFESYATNLVTGDNNGNKDIFIRDVVAGETIRVSAAADGTQVLGWDSLYYPVISGDGSVVAFVTDTAVFDSDDKNGTTDIYYSRLTAGVITATLGISVEAALTEANLKGSLITATVSGDSFISAELKPATITLNNAPTGVSVADVTYVDESTYTIELDYDGTDFDTSVSNFSITIGASALSLGTPLTSNPLPIEALLEPGLLQLAQASYSVTEGTSSLTVTVVRTGGNNGDGSVQYELIDGTATAGSDYVSNSGIISFDDGETSKTFDIAIIDDLLAEDTETFTINLSLYEGAAGLGTTRSATVTITDDDSSAPSLVAENLTATTEEDEAVAITLLATGSTGGMEYSLVAPPTHGTVQISDNIATYTPTTDYSGADSFTYRAVAGALTSNTATVTITVSPTPGKEPQAPDDLRLTVVSSRRIDLAWNDNSTDEDEIGRAHV